MNMKNFCCSFSQYSRNFIYVFAVIFLSYLGQVLIYTIPKIIYLDLHPEWGASKDFDEFLRNGPLFLCLYTFWFIPYITLTLHLILNEKLTRLFFIVLAPASMIISVTFAWILPFFY